MGFDRINQCFPRAAGRAITVLSVTFLRVTFVMKRDLCWAPRAMRAVGAAQGRNGYRGATPARGASSGSSVTNLARWVEKNVRTLRTLASWVNRRSARA